MAPQGALFLGLELAVDQLRATLVDEALDLVGVECVDFDTELAEYQTQGGIFTTPGEAYTTPVEMWIKALDTLFEKLERNYDLTRIKSIGGAAQHALVWWKSTTVPSLSSLDPHVPLVQHFSAAHFSLPNTPVAQDVSSHTHALTIEALVGGPDHMAARVGGAAHPSNLSAQLLRVRETWPQDVWARTGRVQLASAFLASLVAGKWMPMAEAEACASGMWSHTHAAWDEGVLDIVGGSREEGRRVRGWLGDVDSSGGGRRAGTVARYLVERYGFDPDTGVTPFTSDALAAYLSLAPAPGDAVLQFGPMDVLLAPAARYVPTRLYQLYPHPAQDPAEARRYIAVLTNRNADVPRALVRDMYTKSWSAFDRLVAIVPPGGSIGLDDKLFAFWHLQADAHPHAHVKGIYRFETGVKVAEFRDLRANPRCLLESQVLSLRVKYAKMLATGVLARSHPSSSHSQLQGAALASSNALSSIPTRAPAPRPAPPTSAALGLPFDPYDPSPLPVRILATGAAANFPAVANLVTDVFNAPVFLPTSQLASAREAPQRNAPVSGCPGRGAVGAAFMARWVWGRERGAGGAGAGAGSFEEEVRRLQAKRWAAAGGVPPRASVLAPVSGTSTPYTRPVPSRAPNALLEEDEEGEDGDYAADSNYGQGGESYAGSGYGGGNGSGSGRGSPGVGVNYGYAEVGLTPSSSTSSMVPSTAYTSPDLGPSQSQAQTPTSAANFLASLGAGSGSSSLNLNSASASSNLISSGLLSPTSTGLINSNGTGAQTPTTPTPLTPVAPLSTGEGEARAGLVKVAEPDGDAFLAYAALVPEYCRLEGMLVRGIV
ncbi:D-xylulose kinase [Mycena maculata]|uniref:D-xylulose kinase n=1 Tax=Mycena maculata TaxID=230809 RepID=A0AAD7HLX5_9AGAR|nr:D-xylulose kinase [Mycena maculata]